MKHSTEQFLRARNFLIENRTNYEKAYRDFRWPELEDFNWAFDWFDVMAENNSNVALWLQADQPDQGDRASSMDTKLTFAQLSERSSQVASFLKILGINKGDRILVALPNVAPLWDLMLAAMKLGAVLVPTSVQVPAHEILERIRRAQVKMVITDEERISKFSDFSDKLSKDLIRVLVGNRTADWISFDDAYSCSPHFRPTEQTLSSDPFLFYFTSGSTSKPKLVCHTNHSYPVGHLSTLYWLGLQEGDIHCNISSPGWAKHAYSSFFAPWNAGATIYLNQYERFNPKRMIVLLDENSINTLCAPPTVWRMMIQESLGPKPRGVRELTSAGEPLNPEVIERVQKSWGLTVRDGFGQTEATIMLGNSPGQKILLGSIGRPMPGYQLEVLDSLNSSVEEGEMAVKLRPRPTGLMHGYINEGLNTSVIDSSGYYRTGDEGRIDADGYFWFVGRGDDVFKSSDYRISPFELESAILEHHAVAESAVVPSPDPVRTCVPKAFIKLKSGIVPDAATAEDIFSFLNTRLASYQKIRKIEFSDLPKTITGKIRRTELRTQEKCRNISVRGVNEFWL